MKLHKMNKTLAWMNLVEIITDVHHNIAVVVKLT